MVGWLDGWLDEWLVGWMNDCMDGWLVGWMSARQGTEGGKQDTELSVRNGRRRTVVVDPSVARKHN
jgi:hypothetical protein